MTSSSNNNYPLNEREKGWDLGSCNAPYQPYDALRDTNLRQYFESRHVQQFLHNMGWVDKEGRIVDLDKHKSKLNIIEQEFKYAEKAEYWRMKEEEEMRRVIQSKRHRALEEAKRAERLARLKEERRVRQSIIRAMQMSKLMGSVTLPAIGSRKENSTSPAHKTSNNNGQFDSALAETLKVSEGFDRQSPDASGSFFLTQN